MIEENSFVKGIKDGLPICFGYLSVSFAFGLFSITKGLSVLEAVLISMANVTSAGQIAAVPLIVGMGSYIELALTQLVINLRYALMSTSLSQKFGKSIRIFDRFVISFVNTDEVFAVASSKHGVNVGNKYMYGLILTPYLGWTLGTFIGAQIGTFLSPIIISALGIAIYGMFVAIIIPSAKKEKSVAMCVGFAILLGCIFKYTPSLKVISNGFGIIICAVVSSVIFAIVAPIPDEEEGKTDANT